MFQGDDGERLTTPAATLEGNQKTRANSAGVRIGLRSTRTFDGGLKMIIKSNTAGDKLRIVVAKTIASSTSLDIAPSDESESSSVWGYERIWHVIR